MTYVTYSMYDDVKTAGDSAALDQVMLLTK